MTSIGLDIVQNNSVKSSPSDTWYPVSSLLRMRAALYRVTWQAIQNVIFYLPTVNARHL